MAAPRTGAGPPGQIFSSPPAELFPFELTPAERAQVPGTPAYNERRRGEFEHGTASEGSGLPPILGKGGIIQAPGEGAQKYVEGVGKKGAEGFEEGVKEQQKLAESLFPNLKGWVGELFKGVWELVGAEFLRGAELLAGGILVIIGLATIAKGGTLPNVPRPV